MSKSIAALFNQSVLSRHIITSAIIDPDGNNGNGVFILELASGYKIFIEDSGQSCCESRYLHSSDDLSALVGEALVSIKVSEVECRDDRGDDHEVVFLKVTTDKDSITVETHNEHNGYYGGFTIRATVVDPSGYSAGTFDFDTD
jgi:hypothetical protein